MHYTACSWLAACCGGGVTTTSDVNLAAAAAAARLDVIRRSQASCLRDKHTRCGKQL